MTRILADLPQEDIDKLDALAASNKRSRSSAIREAVRLYLIQHDNDKDWIARGAGYWSERDDIRDGVEYQRAMREDRTPYDDI